MSKIKQYAPKGNDYYRNRDDMEFFRDYNRRTKGYAIHAQKDSDDEGSFSWSSCATCGSTLGGTRYACVLANPGVDKRGQKRKAINVSSCEDCLVYAANGGLPPMYDKYGRMYT